MELYLTQSKRTVDVPADGPWYAVFIQRRDEGNVTTYEVVNRHHVPGEPEITGSYATEALAEDALVEMLP